MFFGNKDDDNKNDDRNFIKYKLKSLLVYSSDEWMANAVKKYRTVFDKAETTYLRCEFAFYNKLFDEENWKCKVTLKAIEITNGKREQLCSLDKDIDVSKEENIIYVRDGWGNTEPGAFWIKGEYVWEAYIDKQLVGTQKFYVNDVGAVTAAKNPYFSVEYIKLYHGDAEGWKQEPKSRTYYKQISKKETRYLWAEIKITNLVNLEWNYELFLNYYDDAGQHKAVTSRIGKIETGKRDWTYTFDIGWGTDDGGSWKDDRYTIELVFMDALVAAATFDCGDTFIEGEVESSQNAMTPAVSVAKNENDSATKYDNKSLEELLEELDKLIGLQNVKKHIRDQITLINFNKLRKEQGVEDDSGFSLHSVAIGNPGTGKTTVMRLLGKIYHKLGLLSVGHVLEVDRVDLVGEYIGQTAPKTQKQIEEARGGILFIDEAYSLARSNEDSRDYGKEVIEILLKEMSDGPGDIAIFVAGYPKEMNAFIESNPGLKSRFSQYFIFDDYLPEELYDIGITIADKLKLQIDEEARKTLKLELTDAFRNRNKNFGNARFVEGVINKSKMLMALRLMNNQETQQTLSKETLSTITKEDMVKVFADSKRKQLKLEINENELKLAMDELNELTGMQNIKTEIDELVHLIRYYNEIGKDVLNKFSLHSIFTGNPGTGKTTVARILGKIFKALGILERGHTVETDREGLVAGFIGQTAIKTASRIDEAMGGVLFIDEAYALTEGKGSPNDFGAEAISTILKRMEDNRGKFLVFAAGYPDNMNEFLTANPGLNSRFDKKFHFEDYTSNEMMQIAMMYLKKEDLQLDDTAKIHLETYFTALYKNRDKYYGNARTVRQTIDEAIKNQNLRMAKIPSAERNTQAIHIIIFEDVAEFVYQKESLRKSVGFRLGGN